MESNKKPKAKKPQAKKLKEYKPKAGLSAEELSRRLKQREAALMRKFASASSPQVAAVQRSAKATLRGARECLAALIDPANAEPFRLPGGGRPTFVNKLHYIQASAVVPASASALLAPNCGFAVVRRDPRCALIYSFYKAAPGQSSTYQLMKADGSTTLPQGPGGYLLCTIAKYVVGSGFATHGDYLVPWVFEDGIPRVWFQSETANNSSVGMSGLAATTSYILTISGQLNGVETSVGITATSDGSGNVAFSTISQFVGYAKFRVAASATPNNFLSPTSVTFTDNSTTKVAHLALPQFWTNFQDIDSVRINAASLMYSDRTADQYSQGDIVAYQASGGDTWEKFIGVGTTGSSSAQGLDTYTSVTAYQDMYEGKYKKGRFIPLKPSDDPRELELLNISEAGNAYEIPPIDFARQRNFLYIGFNVGTLGSGVPSPIGKFTAWYGIEGESESQWRETRIPTVHPDVLKEAKWIFAQAKCDFENPSHLKAIWDWVKKNAPHILDVVDMVGPMLPPNISVPLRAGSTAARVGMALLP